jgi:hypothetical protein
MAATRGGAVDMMRFFDRLKIIVDHPVTHLLVGLALMTTGSMQIYDDLIGDSQQFRVGVHHGVVLLGVIQALSALPDVAHGIERWLMAAEIAKAKDRDKETE